MARESADDRERNQVREARVSSLDVARKLWPFAQATLDSAAWLIATLLGTLTRYDFVTRQVNPTGVVLVGVAGVAAQLLGGWLLGLYRRRYHYASLEEVRLFGLSLFLGYLATGAVALLTEGALVPRTVPVIATPMVLAFGLAVRLAHRLVASKRLRPVHSAEPVIVIGAGEAAAMLINAMLRNPNSRYNPVAALDDDSTKQQLRIRGVRVEGTTRDVLAVASRHNARRVVIAVPSATPDELRQLAGPALDAGLEVMVLPPVQDLLGSVDTSDLRTVTLGDLLGRMPAEIDADSIASYLFGQTVLVTGAGGSIGSELCRQIYRYHPANLILVDRDESALHNTALSIDKTWALDQSHLVLADIRDRQRLDEVFATHRPHVVFHAAALKHLAALQHQPTEAWKTNVIGTQNVLDAAVAHGAQRFINISTDKAANPISVLGATKRIAERLTAAVAAETCRPYVSVRFGNVLGSRGSVLGTFQAQIDAGGPVTLTHRDVTRYFMTVQEAVALTIQAGALGDGGQVLVLDMGEPVRILDVAERLIKASGKRIEIDEIGLRIGEKLHEELFGDDEIDVRPNHPLVSQIAVPALGLRDVIELFTDGINATTIVGNCDARPRHRTHV